MKSRNLKNIGLLRQFVVSYSDHPKEKIEPSLSRESKMEKTKLYIALRALDRALSVLQATSVGVPVEVIQFLDEAWDHLRGDQIALRVKKINQKVDSIIKHKDDASILELRVNYFLYAFSTLVLYFSDGVAQSLDFVAEDIVKLYQFDFEQEYIKGRDVLLGIYSDDDLEKIENCKPVAAERGSQAIDWEFAKSIRDWSKIDKIKTIPLHTTEAR